MQIQICQKNPKKNRHIEHYRCCARLDVAELQGENFAGQNSRQESANPRMDLRFLKLRKSLLYKKIPPSRGAVALASHWTERSEGSGRG